MAQYLTSNGSKFEDYLKANPNASMTEMVNAVTGGWKPPESPVPAPQPSYSAPSSYSAQAPSQSNDVPAPWMGNMYQKVQGTNWWSTNPNNPNSAKYTKDGAAVPTLGIYDNGKTLYDGYATKEQQKQIMGLAGNPTAQSNLVNGWLNSGQLNMSNDSIYKQKPSVPAPPAAVAGVSTPSMTVGGPGGSGYTGGTPKPENLPNTGGSPNFTNYALGEQSSVPAPKFQQGNPYNEILYSKKQWEAPGASEGSKAWASNNAKQYYSILSPEEAARVSDMDAAQLEAYINKMAQPVSSSSPNTAPSGGGYAPSTPTTVPAQSGGQPSGYAPMTPAQIQAEAQARINKLIADRSRIADQTKKGLQTSYDRLRQTTNDTRTLEDVRNARNLNPFSGRSDYAQGMIGRERAITDRQQQEDLSTRLGNVDMTLQDFLNQTPEQQQQIINELTRQERAYATDIAQLTGNMADGSRTLSGQQFDWQRSPENPNYQGQKLQNEGMAITNKINQLKLNNLPAEMKANLEILDQQVKNGQIGLQEAEYKLNELTDPNSTTNQAKALDLQLKQMDLEYLPQEQKLKLQQLQKQIDQIGKAPYRTPEEIEYDKVKLDTAKEQLRQLQEKPAPGQINMDDEKRGLMESLRSGNLTPESALNQLDEDFNFGFYTKPQYDELKTIISKLAPSYSKTPTLTKEQQDNMPSENQLDKLVPAGVPEIDWKIWYKDPKGRLAGLSFDKWQELYGPRLGPRK